MTLDIPERLQDAGSFKTDVIVCRFWANKKGVATEPGFKHSVEPLKSAGIPMFTSAALPCRPCEVHCSFNPTFPWTLGHSALPVLRRLCCTTGSLTARLAACLPVSASRKYRYLSPLITGLKYLHLLVWVRQRLLNTLFQRSILT